MVQQYRVLFNGGCVESVPPPASFSRRHVTLPCTKRTLFLSRAVVVLQDVEVFSALQWTPQLLFPSYLFLSPVLSPSQSRTTYFLSAIYCTEPRLRRASAVVWCRELRGRVPSSVWARCNRTRTTPNLRTQDLLPFSMTHPFLWHHPLPYVPYASGSYSLRTRRVDVLA